METPDFLVIGGGIVGVSLARELARASRSVTVLERGRVGGAASTAAAGLLVPSLSSQQLGALAGLCRQSAALYEAWVEELYADGAGDIGFRRTGVLDVWTDALQVEQQRAVLGQQGGPGRRVEFLSAEELRRREPALTGAVAGAACYPDDAQVNPVRMMRGLARVAERAGVTFREFEEVHCLVREGDRIGRVQTAAATYQPGVVVLCTGAWTGTLSSHLGLSLPTRPVRGQMLLADCRVPPLTTPVGAGDALFVPRPDGRLMLGVTVEDAGFADRVTLDGVRAILNRTCALAPAVGGLPLARAWAGLRPVTPDGWPYLGPVPPLRNLWVNAGHGSKGILLAPLCARLLARSLHSGHVVDELAPFQASRV
jgi:glycine oxidase